MLKLTRVSKYYTDSDKAACGLREVSLSFERGEFVLITGPSGAGKTTLLNVVSLLDDYDEGNILFCGESTIDAGKEELEKLRKEHISYVFQEPTLLESLSVLDNLVIPLVNSGQSLSQAKEKAREAIHICHIEDLEKKKVLKLSGGERQRVNLARALAMDTDILLLDEPFSNVDKSMAVELVSTLKENTKGKLVLLTTHDYDLLKPFGTRHVEIQDGQVPLDEKISETMESKEENTKERRKGRPSSSLWTGMKVLFSSPIRFFSLAFSLVILAFSMVLSSAMTSYVYSSLQQKEVFAGYREILDEQSELSLFLHGTNERKLPETLEQEGLTYYNPFSYLPYIRFDISLSDENRTFTWDQVGRYAGLPKTATLEGGKEENKAGLMQQLQFDISTWLRRLFPQRESGQGIPNMVWNPCSISRPSMRSR